MMQDERKEYAIYRMESAFRTFDAAQILAVNRLYYSLFYAVNALLVMNEIQTKSHSSVKGLFSLYFVKTGKFEKKHGKLFSELFDWRQKGDYDDISEFTKEIVLPLFDPVKEMLTLIDLEIKKSI